MRILVTNDDGIDAPGIAVLENIAKTLSDDVWVIAPSKEQSGVSRSLTLHDPLRVGDLGNNHFKVSGSPADCVIMAMQEILANKKPDLVLSGINRGANMADDCLYSGTIGAAFEASQFNVRAIALSQAIQFSGVGEEIYWDTPQHYAADIIKKLIKSDSDFSTIYNLNFPNCPIDAVQGIEVVETGNYDNSVCGVEKRIDARGNDYYWLTYLRRNANLNHQSDLYAITNNKITVTPLHRNLTAQTEMDKTRDLLGSF